MTLLNNEPFCLRPEQGGREAFLMLHGLGGGVYEMRTLGERLHSLGYGVTAINYPGHDKPAPRMPDSTWEEWYESVEANYVSLSKEYERVSVVGFSTGCMLGLHLAASYNQIQPVDRLILLSPFLKIRKEWYYLLQPEHYVHSLGHIIRQIPRLKLPIGDPEMHELAMEAAYFKTFNIPSVQSALALIQVVDAELEQIDRPTLIIQSHLDRVVCPSGAHILMQRLKSTRKEVFWLNDSNHVILLDREREAVMNKIVEFVGPPVLPDPYAVKHPSEGEFPAGSGEGSGLT